MSRLLRNRVSAQQARERKKQYLGELESRLSSLEQRHGELEERLSTLQRENFMLRQVGALLGQGQYEQPFGACRRVFCDAFCLGR